MIDLKLIKPKIKGESDKYSWNLYKWINKYKRNKVYFLRDKYCIEFDIKNIRLSNIIIGNKASDGCVTGNRLSSIISNGTGRNDCWAFDRFGGWKYENFIDITDIFWSNYIKNGRCFLFGHRDIWLQGDKDKFTYINNTRRCNWCGKWERKRIDKIVKIERREIWE